MSRPAEWNNQLALQMKKNQESDLTQTGNAVKHVWWTITFLSERVRVQRPINDHVKKNNPSAPANPCSTFVTPCASRRGAHGNVQLIQPRRPTLWKTKLQIPRSAVVAATVSRMYHTRWALSRVTAMNHSPRSRAHLPRSRQPLSLTWQSDCLPSSSSLLFATWVWSAAIMMLVDSFCLRGPAAHRSDSTCDCRCLVVDLLWPQVSVKVVFQNFKRYICDVRRTKCQFRAQLAKVQVQIRVFYDALLRILAVGVVSMQP